MPYPTCEEITARAAEKGFRVGTYVHMSTTTAAEAGPIREFSAINGQVVAVWMDGACRNLLGELRLSRQHRLAYQFPGDYDFFISPSLIAEACRRAGSKELTANYTAVRVRNFEGQETDTWVTTSGEPHGEQAVFVPLQPQPVEQPFGRLSPGMELLVANQRVTVDDVAHWMGADAKQGKKLFVDMQSRYGQAPTLLNLTMFSGATMLEAVAGSVMQARKRITR